MDYKEFEAATAALYQALGEGHGIEIECYGATCRVKGQSGATYQIDVLAKQSNGLQTIRTAVECKHWKRKVGQRVVSELVGVIADANIEKGAIVSKEGFTSGAMAVAKGSNISLVEMREPNDKDWEGKIKEVRFIINRSIPNFYDIELVQPSEPGGESVKYSLVGQNTLVVEPGKEPVTLDEIANNAISKGVAPDELIEVHFPPGTALQIVGFDKTGRIDAFRFKVRYSTQRVEDVFDAADRIRLIVKEVFEGRQFTVGRDGVVREITNAELRGN